MGPNDYEVRVEVSISNYQGQGSLRLADTVNIPDCTFEDMATILRGFHELARSLKEVKTAEGRLIYGPKKETS